MRGKKFLSMSEVEVIESCRLLGLVLLHYRTFQRHIIEVLIIKFIDFFDVKFKAKLRLKR